MVTPRAPVVAPEITPGVHVDVRTRYLRTWASGFEVVAVDGDQLRLRRRVDGTALPVTVPLTDVRVSL